MTSSPLYGIMVNMKATHEQQCVACEAPISLPAPDPMVEYCDPCTQEIEAWHDERERDWAAAEAEAFMAQYDNDPSPYDGNYSEE